MADTTDKRVKELLERYAAGQRDFGALELAGIDLSAANLSGADFARTNLSNANLTSCTLHLTDFDTCNLSEADLRDAGLVGATLTQADLRKTNLGAANISWSSIQDANLEGTDLRRAVCGSTSFADLDLRPAIGLEEILHHGPSTIGIDTLYKSHGKIPEAFMRGCGVPDSFITFARSLVGKAIDFYSCFISYSSKDEEFAARLYADLQANHVRCWFAPEDLKIGDKFRQKIDETIRVYDKVIIVLSEESIGSDWVESEVEAALEKERKTKRTVLFPIRLDEAVMDCEIAWAAEIRRIRHIGDFSGWKEHDAYKKAFERVLRDLKAEAPGPGQ